MKETIIYSYYINFTRIKQRLLINSNTNRDLIIWSNDSFWETLKWVLIISSFLKMNILKVSYRKIHTHIYVLFFFFFYFLQFLVSQNYVRMFLISRFLIKQVWNYSHDAFIYIQCFIHLNINYVWADTICNTTRCDLETTCFR